MKFKGKWLIGSVVTCVAVVAVAVAVLVSGGASHASRTAVIKRTGAPLTPDQWAALTAAGSSTSPTVTVTETGNVPCANGLAIKAVVMSFKNKVTGGWDQSLNDPDGDWVPTSTFQFSTPDGPVALPEPASGTGYTQVQTTGSDCSGSPITETTPPLAVGGGAVTGVSVPTAPLGLHLNMYRINGQSQPTWTATWSPPSQLTSCPQGGPGGYHLTLEGSPNGTSNWAPVWEAAYANSPVQNPLFSGGISIAYVRALVSMNTPCGQTGAAAVSNTINAQQY